MKSIVAALRGCQWLAALSLLTVWQPVHAESTPPPNIIVVMADDLGYHDLACYGQRRFPTPHSDRLAREGMRFTDAHAPCAVCSPTRYAVVTGTDPFRRYHTSHVLFNGEPLVIARDQPTIASLLQRKGYRTGVVGKWHLGLGDALPRDLNHPGRGPNQIGFDESYLVPDGHNMLPHYYLANGEVVGGTAEPFLARPVLLGRVGYKLVQNQPLGRWEHRRPAERIGARLTEQAVAFIERNQDRPFFLYFPTCSIHTPHVPDPRFRGNSGIGPHGDYVMEFDWSVGQIMEALDRLDLTDDTLLIVTSDNGGLNEKNGHNPNHPWRGMKGSAFEGGHRVPMIVRWPGHIPPESVCDETVSLVDLTATCCEIAEVPLPASAALDSFSLQPLLLDEAGVAPLRPYTVMGTRGMEQLALRQGAWKLIVSPEGERTRLYHLGRDPGESQDLSATHVEKREELRALLTRYVTSGRSRPGAEAKGSSFGAIFRERDERNQRIEARLTGPPESQEIQPASDNDRDHQPAMPPVWKQTLTLSAPEAHQAAAADEQFVYAITNKRIAKYDRQTKQRLAVSTGEADHLNSGFFWRGRLYCAQSNYPQRPERSEIKVLDPATMRLSTFKDFGEYGGSLTWVVREQDHWWCNFAHYGDDNHKTFLVKFDDQWREKGRWTYPPEVVRELGRYSISGGVWRAGRLLVTDHDHPRLFCLQLPRQGSVLELVEKQVAPFTGQGIADDPKSGGLVGIHRAKKQVVFAELEE